MINLKELKKIMIWSFVLTIFILMLSLVLVIKLYGIKSFICIPNHQVTQQDFICGGSDGDGNGEVNCNQSWEN